MANPTPNPSGGSTGKFSSGFAPGSTAKKVAPKASAPKTVNPIDAMIHGIVTGGQAALNTLMTPMYFIEESAWKGIHNLNDPKAGAKAAEAQAKNPLGYLGWLGQQTAESWNTATGWSRGQEIKHTGGAIAKELGLINPNSDAGAVAQNTAVGLAFDIALDPTTYIPGGAVFKVLKGISKGTEGVAKGAAMANKGWMSVERAAAKGVTPELAQGAKEVTVKGARLKKILPETASEAALAKQATYQEKLAGTTSHMVKVPDAVEVNAKDIVATGLDMGLKALRGSLLSHNANKFIEGYMKKGNFAQKLSTHIASATAPVDAKAAETAAADLVAKTAEPAAKAATPVAKIAESSVHGVDLPSAVTDEALSLSSTEASALNKTLSKMDKIAKEATGTARAVDSTAQAVESVIAGRMRLADVAFQNIPKDIQSNVAKGYADAPFQTIEKALTSGDKHYQEFGKRLANTPLTLSTGRTTMRDLMAHGANFFKLPAADKKVILRQFEIATNPSVAEAAVTKRLGEMISDKGLLAELMKFKPASSSKADVAGIKSVLERISTSAQIAERKYANADEIVAGLKAGDSIPTDILKKLIRALNPDAKLIEDINKKMAKMSDAQLADILRSPKAVQTLAEMRSRVYNAKQSQFIESTGITGSETVAAFYDALSNGSLELITPIIEHYSRRQSAKRVASMSNSLTSTVTTVFREAFGKRMEHIEEIMANPGAKVFASSFDDLTIMSAEKKWTGKAILPNQLNQSFQNIISSKFAGIETAKAVKRAAKATAVETATENVSVRKMTEFVHLMSWADDLASAVFGSRMFVQKTVADAAETDSLKHSVFLHMGDVAQEFMKTPEGTAAMSRAFFITEKGTLKTDSLDVVSILQATRHALEMKSAGKMYTVDEVAAIARRKANEKALSPKYRKQIDAIAKDFADHLVNKALPGLEETHLNRAKSMVSDFTSRSMDILPGAINMYKNAQLAAIRGGFATDAQRFQYMQDMFSRFTYLSGILRQESGDIAASVMRATSLLFLKSGKIVEETGSELDKIYSLIPDLKSEEYAKMMESFNSYTRNESPLLAAPVGRERIKPPTAEIQDKVRADYMEARDAFEKHITVASKSIKTARELQTWRTTFAKLSNGLQKQRVAMYRAWMEPEHWSNINQSFVHWKNFDHAAEVEWAKNQPVILVDGKAVKVASEAVDVPAKEIKLAPEVEKVPVDKARAKAKKHQTEITDAGLQDNSLKVLEKQKQIEALPLDPGEQAQRMLQEYYNNFIEASRPKVYIFDTTIQNAARAREAAVEDVKAFGATIESQGFMQRLGERMSATAYKGDVASLLQIAESTLRKVQSDMVHAADKFVTAFPDQIKDFAFFQKAFSRSLHPEAVIDETLSPVEQAFQRQLNELMSHIINDAELNGISSDIMKSALKQYGLAEENGFVVGGSLVDFLEKVPFAEIDAVEGTADYDKLLNRQKDYVTNGSHAINDLRKLFSAIQHAKMHQTLAASTVSLFGWKGAGFASMEAARKAGWVEVRAAGDRSEWISAMVGPEDGALFHPEVAAHIAATDRARAKLFSGERMPQLATAIMNLTSYIKFAQTSINPRHHVTNDIGDTTSALIGGATNPVYWYMAFKVAGKYNKQIWKTEYAKGALKPSMARLFSHLDTPENVGKTLDAWTKEGKFAVPVKFVSGKKGFTEEDLVRYFGEKNIATGNMFQDESLGFYEHVLGDIYAQGTERSMLNVINEKAKIGIEKFMKPFGDFSASYSNVPRIATAIKVMLSRTWNSEAEMWAAVAKEVHLYHPTISSLSAFERRYGRLAIGYYTWLRGAHSALADMVVNHTAAMMVAPKLLSNVRQANQVNQLSPGTPWGTDVNVPLNMQSSLYGPLWQGQNGPTGIQTSTLPLDVMQQWPMYYDPMLNTDQMMGANIAALGKYLGGSANPIVREVAQEMLGMDFQTGATYTNRSGSAIMSRFIQTLGPSQLAKGLGWWTPVDKNITQENRDLALRKWLTGSKEFNVGDPGVQKAALKELNARLKSFQSNINNQGK